jgi:hypothetical protein
LPSSSSWPASSNGPDSHTVSFDPSSFPSFTNPTPNLSFAAALGGTPGNASASDSASAFDFASFEAVVGEEDLFAGFGDFEGFGWMGLG